MGVKPVTALLKPTSAWLPKLSYLYKKINYQHLEYSRGTQTLEKVPVYENCLFLIAQGQ